jgi:hopanoid biosynthesis associated RND transporter like protein HpnN
MQPPTPTSGAREGFALRMLRHLADWVFRYPRWFAYPQIVLAAIAVYYTIGHLEFDTSRDNLVGADKKYHRNFLQFKKEFPNQDDLVVVVESESMLKNRQFVERLGSRLEAETNLFTDVLYKGDLKLMGRKALLFLDTNTLSELDKTLTDYHPFIQNFTAATNLDSLFRLVNRQFRTAKREASAENESMVKAMPALQRIIDEARDGLERSGTPHSPGLNALFGAGPEAEKETYVTFADGRLYLVSAQPRNGDVTRRAVERLRELAYEVQAEVPGVNIGITGEPVLEYDEMEQSQRDTMVATVVALILVALIFIYGYQETGRPIKATLCLLVGLAYTMGFTTLTIGHLNILTITFLPMLIGLAIDFGVHLVTRYEEELRHGHGEREAMQKAMVFTGLGIFTGCLTTAVAFLAMGATNFKGIQEMGIISGCGLLICLVPMMTLLPVMLMHGHQNIIDKAHVTHEERRARIERIWLQRPYRMIGGTLALCALCAWGFDKVHFDYNLLHMQSAGLPAVQTEIKLINSATNSVLFGVVIANTKEEASRLESQITNLSTVANVHAMSTYMVGDARPKLEKIGKIKKEAASVQFGAIDRAPADVRELDQTLWALQGYLGLAAEEVQKENDAALEASLRAMRASVVQLRQTMQNGNVTNVSEKLGAFQRALFTDVHDTFAALRDQDDSGALQPEDLPDTLRKRFIGVTGKYLIQVYPKGNVWERKTQEAFIKQLRTIDPNVTGTPVQLFEYTTLLKNSYQTAAWYSLVAILIMVFLHFRSVVCVVLAFLPVAIGTIWMMGFMVWMDIPFNPANIMTLPLVIGIGVTNGIHILNRYAEEQNPGILAKSTGKAVLVSALSTMAGFGSLILGKHQGIQSLGYVMAVGTMTCMIASLTFLPSLIMLLNRWGWKVSKLDPCKKIEEPAVETIKS